MGYYHVCPYCGASLDPGEHCDCERSLEYAFNPFSKIVPAPPVPEEKENKSAPVIRAAVHW